MRKQVWRLRTAAACLTVAVLACGRSADRPRVVADSQLHLVERPWGDSTLTATLAPPATNAAKPRPRPSAPPTPSHPRRPHTTPPKATKPSAPRASAAPGRDSATAVRGALLLVEDFRNYQTIQDFLRVDPRGRWRDRGSGSGRMSLDPGAGFGGSPHALRYDFPAGDPGHGGCDDYNIGRAMYLPASQKELWVEFYVKFQRGWHTQAPASWRCTRAADHKLLRGYVSGVEKYDYFGLKDGHFGHAWTSSAPTPEHWDKSLPFSSRDVYDGRWVRIRVHWKVGRAPDYGLTQVWVNGRQIDNTRFSTDATGIYMLRIGANMNNLVEAPQSMWWGQIKVWNTNPGW